MYPEFYNTFATGLEITFNMRDVSTPCFPLSMNTANSIGQNICEKRGTGQVTPRRHLDWTSRRGHPAHLSLCHKTATSTNARMPIQHASRFFVKQGSRNSSNRDMRPTSKSGSGLPLSAQDESNLLGLSGPQESLQREPMDSPYTKPYKQIFLAHRLLALSSHGRICTLTTPQSLMLCFFTTVNMLHHRANRKYRTEIGRAPQHFSLLALSHLRPPSTGPVTLAAAAPTASQYLDGATLLRVLLFMFSFMHHIVLR